MVAPIHAPAHLEASMLDVLEDVGHRAQGHVGGRGAEMLERGLVRERGLGAEEAHRERSFQGPARGEDLDPHRPHRCDRPGSGVGGGEARENLRLAFGDVRRSILPTFEVSDPEDGLGALVEEVEDLVVELVDPGTPIVQVHSDPCPSTEYRAL